MQQYEGGCLCGAVRFRVTGPAIDTGYCHCRMCQKNSGAPAVAWSTFPAEGFQWLRGEPGRYASSARAHRHFCRDCGSYMIFRTEGSREVSVNTASLDDPAPFAPRAHIFSESRLPWFDTADALPRQQGYGPHLG